MSGRKKIKTNIHMSKPELPPFLQKMRDQIVANEDADRRERGEWDRKNRAAGRPNQNNDEDDPTIVKLDENDITEEEYKRMKLELETQYKLNEPQRVEQSEELDIDNLIEMGRAGGRKLAGEPADQSVDKSARRELPRGRGPAREQGARRAGGSSKQSDDRTAAAATTSSKLNKKLSYGSSDDDEDDDD